MAIKYVDCTVTFKDSKNLTIEYEEEGKIRSADGFVGSDPFTDLTVRRLNNLVNYATKVQELSYRLEEIKTLGNPIEFDDLKAIGLNLYQILFGNAKIANAFKAAYSDFDRRYKELKQRLEQKERANLTADPELRMRLLLVFEKDAEKLGELPWEFLRIPGEGNDIETGFFFISNQTQLILTRYMPPTALMKKFLDAEPPSKQLRILVVVCSPKGGGLGTLSGPDLDTVLGEIKAIETAQVRIIPSKDDEVPTYTAIETAIRDQPPHILHFVGHGRPGELALIMDTKEDLNYDEKMGDKPPYWIDSGQFLQLLGDHKPRLIFLHACQGAAPTSHAGFKSIARELLRAEIPAVVAMQYTITNKEAGRFATTFYKELGNGSAIDEAVQEARRALGKMPPEWKHHRFGTPVIYLRSEKAIVVTPSPVIGPETKDVTQTGAETEAAALTGSMRRSRRRAAVTGAVRVGEEPDTTPLAPAVEQESRSEFKG
jgi:hypothetical protein